MTEQCNVCECREQNAKCKSSLSHSTIGDNFCNDENNNEKCYWDGGDCCGETIKIVDQHGNPTCSACACHMHTWNDNTCEEFRRFICEKEGTG